MTPIKLTNGTRWLEEVCRAHGINWDRITRVIIDGKAGEPVYLYVIQIGEDHEISVLPPDVTPPEVKA